MKSYYLANYSGDHTPYHGVKWERCSSMLESDKQAMQKEHPNKVFITVIRCEEYLPNGCKLTSCYIGERLFLVKEEYK